MENWKNLPLWESIYNMLTEPAGFHLWFLRDLICFIAISPVLWWISEKSWIAAVVLSVVANNWVPWLFWFWLGIIIGTQKWDVARMPKSIWIMVLTGCIYFGSAIISGMGLHEQMPKVYGIVGLTIKLSSIFFVWSIYDIIAHGRCLSKHGLWKYLCGYRFFIYCFHEPVFNIIKKLGIAVFGGSEPALIILYLINPLIMVGFAIFVAKTMQKVRLFVPVYKVLTGGR